ncbi:hypothetical protein [Paracoccus marcusii]|uniref:hypothetical protein n=1 Tax=Paracoccus marcusii TaxID=59779 RepID=UPI003736F1CE
MGFWRGEFSPEEINFILDQVRNFRVRDHDGRISLTGAGNYEGWQAILVSAVGLEFRTDALRTRIVRAALFSTDLPLEFSDHDFRKIVYNLRHKYQDKKIKNYRVAFTIWNLPSFLQCTKKIGEVTLNFSPSQSTRIFKTIVHERNNQQTHRDYEFFFTKDRLKDLRNCSICLAHVRASSPADANERASEALYEILGLVNLAADGGKYWRLSSRVAGKLPVSGVLIGPHTTTHFENGKLTHDGFWHENWVGGPNRKVLNAEFMEVWEKRVQQLTLGISKSPWRAKCKSAAVRYFKAFSNPNLEDSFLDGWRLFENISGSRYEKINYQLLRASNIFKDNQEYLVIGRHLALRRNLLAHGHAIKTDDEETLAFQMLQFVVPFLERYILNGFRFRSPDEFWEFLELPVRQHDRLADRAELERRLALLGKAAKFRGETDW